MLHHDRNYLASLDQERLRRAAHRQLPPDAGELERVVLAASAGDQAAWSALVARFEKHTRWVARWHGLGAHDADDVAQETMLRLFRNILRIRDHGALRGWLTTTARRESVRTSKARLRECPTGADLAAELATPDDAFDALEAQARAQALAGALECLPDRHRLLMTALLAEPAPTYAEVSATLGIPIGSIGPTRARCLDRIRRQHAHHGILAGFE
jgi:RNA polymerase sigma factor (sigma-70 family)